MCVGVWMRECVDDVLHVNNDHWAFLSSIVCKTSSAFGCCCSGLRTHDDNNMLCTFTHRQSPTQLLLATNFRVPRSYLFLNSFIFGGHFRCIASRIFLHTQTHSPQSTEHLFPLNMTLSHSHTRRSHHIFSLSLSFANEFYLCENRSGYTELYSAVRQPFTTRNRLHTMTQQHLMTFGTLCNPTRKNLLCFIHEAIVLSIGLCSVLCFRIRFNDNNLPLYNGYIVVHTDKSVFVCLPSA